MKKEGNYSYVGYGHTKRFRREITSWDFDGVLREGNCTPGEYDIVITGRTIEEAHIVYDRLEELGLMPMPVYFNPIHLKDRKNHCDFARCKSGIHKASIIKLLKDNGVNIVEHHEDDPIQADYIAEAYPEIRLVMYPFSHENNED